MAAPTNLQIMDGLETALATIAGLRVREVNPGAISPPCAVVGVPPVTYRQTMGRGVMRLPFTIRVFTSTAYDRAGQRLLAEYASAVGDKSVLLALEADKTLGGVVHDLMVEDFTPLGDQEIAAMTFFGGAWTVSVLASGT